jgi:hypothetical protein
MSITYADPPGVENKVLEGDAKILQLESIKTFSEEHTLNLAIYKISLGVDCELSSKILPLVVKLSEKKGKDRFTDFYSFDNNGILLCHGYYSYDGEKKKHSPEAHDLSLDRLIEHGETIRGMIRHVPIYAQMSMHNTVNELRENALTDRRKKTNN